MSITFDQETHTYYRDGVVTQSVTQNLERAGKINKRFYKPGKADRGTRIHEATEYMDNLGLCCDDFLEEGIHGFLVAWDRFLKDTGAKVEQIEMIVDCPELDYAGTLDRIITWRGKTWVLDIKTGTKADWHRLQLQAYGYAAGVDPAGIVVYLKESGKYTTWIRDLLDAELDREEWLKIAKEQMNE